MTETSLWPRLAALPLVIEAYEFERSGHHGRRLRARDHADPPERRRHRRPRRGRLAVRRRSHHVARTRPRPAAGGRVDAGELLRPPRRRSTSGPRPPEWDMARRWRNWAYESAALDLALQQAGRPLHDVLGLEPRPITYVNSLGLGDPPTPRPILRRLEHYPDLRFKLDAPPTWTPEIVDAGRHRRRRDHRLQGPVRDGGRGRRRARPRVRR